jgi:hypothetical protein
MVVFAICAGSSVWRAFPVIFAKLFVNLPSQVKNKNQKQEQKQNKENPSLSHLTEKMR